MSNELELFRVILSGGQKVWVGVLLGIPFIEFDDDKTAILLEMCGFGILVESGQPLTAADILDLAQGHPVLGQVPNWKRLGIVAGGCSKKKLRKRKKR